MPRTRNTAASGQIVSDVHWVPALVLLVLWFSVNQAHPWTVEAVDCPKWFAGMSDRSLALDADGHPHVIYGGDRLYYATYDGTSWCYETADTSSGLGLYASLALDFGGNPRVSYYDQRNGNLKYAWREASGWRNEVVGNGSLSSLALDEDGNPHIGYVSGGFDGVVRHACKNTSGWQIETVVGDVSVEAISLDIGCGGSPGLAFFERGSPDDKLRYARRDSTGWHVETADSIRLGGGYCSIVLDAAGGPRIAYRGEDGLAYAWKDSVGWWIESVDDEGWIGEYPSLALDSQDNPHISYYRHVQSLISGRLKYAHRDAAGWHVQNADGSGNAGRFTSIALDAVDSPHITHFDNANGELRYVSRNGNAWDICTVDTGSSVGPYTSLAVDTRGQPHISYYDEGRGDLAYCYHGPVGWRFETVHTQGNVGLYTSIAIDQAGYPHISYHDDALNDNLRYAYKDSAGWHTQLVDWSSDCGMWTSLALDESDNPHISYLGDYSTSVKYAHRDSSGWHRETVTYAPFNAGPTSLALDAAGHPHITYYGHEWAFGLFYAYKDGLDWNILVVDSGDGVGANSSLALDAEGNPHISYRAVGSLNYAFRDTLGWHRETVDLQGAAEYTSLVVDQYSSPLIAYYEVRYGDLKLAWKDVSGWHTNTLVSEGDVGQYASLGLDASGSPCISFYDNTQKDLCYVSGEMVASPRYPDPALRETVKLIGLTPNPAGERTAISFVVDLGLMRRARHTSLKVYDPLGRLVSTVTDQAFHSGIHTVSWDLSSTEDHVLGPGVYMVRLIADNPPESDVKTIVVVR